MITNLPGYLLNECLHEGVDTVIYRGRSKSDFSTVIVKTIKAQYPAIKAITCLRHEYKILQALNHIPGIAKAHSLEKYGNSSALILEDFWGISFQQLLTLGKLPVLSFLPIAIQLAAILDGIHKNYIIHKDVNPRNILLDPDKLTVKLIDFSVASWLSKENPCIKNTDNLEGTLAYISPEQTGRINRAVDYRTDFYSLGVTCYEMLTGRLPFTTTDALELVHCHIAKNPIIPHEIDPEIPQAVSDIVLKLMSKNTEDRYQNALALKADLETCLYQLQSQGEITRFPVGELDQSSQFLIPQKLYGRKNEVRSLLAEFRQVRAGSKEFMLVSGEFGIGKTSIVNEIHKTIVQQGGYFISGKFDQLEKKIPHTVFIQILQELIQQILTESPEKIANWQQKILKALGQNGQVLIDVIPALEQIIGSQPQVTILATTAAQNRLHHILLQFFDVVAQPEHPLVLFLDDLQWADAASLKLIENLICNPETKYLLLIGAYRDSEVSSNHPTIITIEKIYFCKARVHKIVLQPLNFDDIYELISDTYNNQFTNPQQEEKIRELSQLIYHKTQGNPFFITQILQRLDAEGLIYFDFAKRQWQWKITEIQAVEITDRQIVDLIVSNIKKLPDMTQQVLELAACMGHQFTLENLAIASKTSIQNTAKMLWDALQSGVILPVLQTSQAPQHRQADDVQVTYKFLCDRLQQRIYSLIPDDQKQKMHLSIGRLLLQQTPDFAIEENIFNIVNQLNIARELVTQVTDKEHLAYLNLIAADVAKQSKAYAVALKYLYIGLELLPKTIWVTNYELALNIHTTVVETEYLNNNDEQAQKLSDIVLAKAKQPLDKIKIYEAKIQFHLTQNQITAAIDTAFIALKILNIPLPKIPNQVDILGNSLITKMVSRAKGIDNLVQLPEMTDPYKIAAMRILISILIPAFLTTPHFFPLLTFTMIDLSVRYGNSPQAAYGYALYAWLLCGTLVDIKSGYEFGQLAMKLLEQFNTTEINSKIVYIFHTFIRPWQEHGREIIPAFVEALEMNLRIGNIEYAVYSSVNYCHYIFLLGENLDHVQDSQKRYIDLMRKLKQEQAIQSISIVKQTVANLLEESANPCCLIFDSFNEAEVVNSINPLFMVYSYKAMLQYLFAEYDESVKNAELAENYATSFFGFMGLATHSFYYCLALLAIYPTQYDPEAQKQILKKVEIHQQKISNWAAHAPENYQHKYELIAAEKARILGSNLKAIAHYKAAIQGAAKYGYTQEEALANELVAEFYFTCNQVAIAEVFLVKAYYGYIHWGATAKVKHLESRYPGFFSRIIHRENTSVDISQIKVTSKFKIPLVALEIGAVTKALQAIESEDNFEQLLVKLMLVTIEAAGASKGVLLLLKDGKLQPVARSFSVFAINNELAIKETKSSVAFEYKVSLLSPPSKAEPLLDLPISLINYVERTQKAVLLNNARIEGIFINDPYILQNQPKSIYCCPLIHYQQFIGLIYLENNLSVGAFTNAGLEVLKLLAFQASISLLDI